MAFSSYLCDIVERRLRLKILTTRLNISQACQIFGIFLPPLLRGISMSEIPTQRDDILQIKMGCKTFDQICSSLMSLVGFLVNLFPDRALSTGYY